MKSNSVTILIVDDNPANVLLLRSMLQRQGYTIFTASNGIDARKIAAEKQPNLILLDVIMPGEDGFTTCEKLKANPRSMDIPVIFISAMDDYKSKVKGLSIGAWDYIPKPFHKAEVLARVKNYLRLQYAFLRVIEEQANRLKQIKDAQQAILVRPEELPEVVFGVNYLPVLEAGGDFYDAFEINSGAYGFFVADISGHDLGASFTTAALKTLIRQNSSQLLSPSETFRIINTVIKSIFHDGQHLTAAYACLDQNANTLSIVNAAHLPILILPPEGEPYWLEADGDVIGAFEFASYESHSVQLHGGERFFLFSDGLIESFHDRPRQREEGLEELMECAKATIKLDVQEAIDQMVQQMFSGNRLSEDDVVLLGVDVPHRSDKRASSEIYDLQPLENGFQLRFNATFSRIDQACADIKSFLKKHALSHATFEVILGVREVLTNAVRHGCKMDKKKNIDLIITYNNSELLIKVADPGAGFDWHSTMQQCLASENATSGRGLSILAQYFDKFSYNKSGNTIELNKKIQPSTE